MGRIQSAFNPRRTVPHGAPTDDGYANDLVAAERARWGDLQLVQLGCPGETTLTMLDGGDACHASVSQLGLAVSFLRQHPSTVLVTVDVGFNDMVHCLGHHEVDEACVDLALANVRTQLPQILAALRAAGGPALHIVGVGHYDPYLVASLDGPAGKSFAAESLDVITRLNEALRSAYAAAGITMADVADAFDMDNTAPAALPDGEAVPLDVARLCALTWACVPGPLGPQQAPQRRGLPAHQRGHQRRGVKPLTGLCMGHGSNRRARAGPHRSPVAVRRASVARPQGSRAVHDAAPASVR